MVSGGEAYLDLYFYRIFLTNSALFVFGAQLIGYLLNAEEEQIDRVINFTVGYSLALQIVNDNADFIYRVLGKEGEVNYPVCKERIDILCDLRNKVITLPVAFHLGIASKKMNQKVRFILNLSKQNTKIEINPALILEEMILSKAISHSIKIGRLLVAQAKLFLSPRIPATAMLNDMLEIANWNKYYYSLDKFERIFSSKESHEKIINRLADISRKRSEHQKIENVEKQKYVLDNGKIIHVRTATVYVSYNQLSLFEPINKSISLSENIRLQPAEPPKFNPNQLTLF